MEKTGFLEEAPHVKSSTRLAFLSGIFCVLAMTGYMVYHLEDPVKVATFLAGGVAAFGGAKYFGTKNESVTTDVPKQ